MVNKINCVLFSLESYKSYFSIDVGSKPEFSPEEVERECYVKIEVQLKFVVILLINMVKISDCRIIYINIYRCNLIDDKSNISTDYLVAFMANISSRIDVKIFHVKLLIHRHFANNDRLYRSCNIAARNEIIISLLGFHITAIYPTYDYDVMNVFNFIFCYINSRQESVSMCMVAEVERGLPTHAGDHHPEERVINFSVHDITESFDI